MKTRPTIDRLRAVLRYDAGRLYWIKRPDPMATSAVVGQEAGRSSAVDYNDIQIDGCRMKAHHSEIAAARAYNDAAIRLHGQFARLNQIDGSTA